MDISDELIGCYIEGTCTNEELKAVRDYLVRNPEEYDRILCLMDNYRDYHIESDSVYDTAGSKNGDYLAFSLASAAFVPFDPSSPAPPKKNSQKSTIWHLNKLWNEIDAL